MDAQPVGTGGTSMASPAGNGVLQGQLPNRYIRGKAVGSEGGSLISHQRPGRRDRDATGGDELKSRSVLRVRDSCPTDRVADTEVICGLQRTSIQHRSKGLGLTKIVDPPAHDRTHRTRSHLFVGFHNLDLHEAKLQNLKNNPRQISPFRFVGKAF